jgi:ribonucleoside-diphosphate reductase alpha chain
MDIFDSTCFTVSSAGGRRGAQMATFAIWHPDVEEFIKAKREDGRLRQFNLSLLMDDEFFEAVKSKSTYDLVFPVKQSEIEKGLLIGELIRKKRFWDIDYCKEMGYDINSDDEILCQVFKTINAVDLWDTIMKSTYDFAEPGILLIDRINEYNNNWFCEEIRATNPCVTGDTLVSTPNGNITMKELVESKENQVLSYNTELSRIEIQEVTYKALTRENADIIEIELDDGKTLKLTPDHKVYTSNRGYVEAINLKEYDDIITE